jgi:hypothetical protein
MTFTAILIDDSITTCECCGRANLKATVLMQSDLGELVHFGRICAARNTGKTSQLRRAGTQITRALVREVAATFRADAAILIQQWA